jgi:hypothetical protein
MNCPGEDRRHRARQIQPTPESKMPGSESNLSPGATDLPQAIGLAAGENIKVRFETIV